MNNLFHDCDIDMLDDTLINNKGIHKSPLIYLEEILIYNYTMEDLMKCGQNYKENALSECNDGFSETLTYYVNILRKFVSQPVLERFLKYLIEYKYCIFHISNDAIYLVSTNPDYMDSDEAICIDLYTPTLNKSGYAKTATTDYIESELLNWKSFAMCMSFDNPNKPLNFKNYICNKYDETKLPRELRILLNENPEYNTSVTTQVSYVKESLEFDNDFNDFVLEPATEARKAKTPQENVEDGLSSLEEISDDDNEGDDGSNAPSSVDNTSETRRTQNNVIDAASATNDQMESDGQDTMDDVGDDDDTTDANDEDDDTDDSNADDSNDDNEDTSDDTDTDDEDPLNNSRDKKKYHEKLKKLYKHINDTIDTLETFTPAYDSNYVETYYRIQYHFARLRSAVFRICTQTANEMDVVDLMKKYSTANMTYDTLIQMFKDFMVKYKQERNKNRK